MKKAEGRRLTKGSPSPEAKRAADKFFAHKKKRPEAVPEDKKTPIGKRMQSGGAGATKEESQRILANLPKSKFKIPKKLLNK